MSYGMKRVVDPFREKPLHRAFYHPSPPKHLSKRDQQNKQESEKSDSQRPNSCLTPEEEAFLRGSYVYQKPYKLPTNHDTIQAPDEDLSSKFDESWPGSERPSSIGIADPSSQCDDMLREAQSRGSISSLYTRNFDSTSPIPEHVRSRIDFDGISDGELENHKSSTLSKYLERFRKGEPMSRNERHKERIIDKKDFWWLGSASSVPSNSTPKEGEVSMATKTHSRTANGMDGRQPKSMLTVKNLVSSDLADPRIPANPWGSDEQTRLLQQRTDILLEKTASSLSSSEPMVSTDGLGHTSADTSTTSEETYRPHFTQRNITDATRFSRHKPASKDEDILYQWRVKRRMEIAKEKLSVGGGARYAGGPGRFAGGTGRLPPDTERFSRDAEHHRKDIGIEELDSKLADFRTKLSIRSMNLSPNFTPAPKLDHNKEIPTIGNIPSIIKSSSFPVACPHLHNYTREARNEILSTVPPHLHLSCDVIPQWQDKCSNTDPDTRQNLNSQPEHSCCDCKNNKGAMKTEMKCVLEKGLCSTDGEKLNVTEIRNEKFVNRRIGAIRGQEFVDSSFEAVKNKHLESLRSEGISDVDELAPEPKSMEVDLIPEKDSGSTVGIIDNDMPRSKGHIKSHSDCDSHLSDFTVVSDIEDDVKRSSMKKDLHEKDTKTGRKSRNEEKISKSKLDKSGGKMKILNKDRKRDQIADVTEREPSLYDKGQRSGKSQGHPKGTQSIQDPLYHSSPMQQVSSAIEQAVRDHALSSSVSATDSESSINVTEVVESNHSKTPLVSVVGVKEDGTVSHLQIGSDVIALSDEEEFKDDEILSDLRKRRQYFLRQLQQLDQAL